MENSQIFHITPVWNIWYCHMAGISITYPLGDNINPQGFPEFVSIQNPQKTEIGTVCI